MKKSNNRLVTKLYYDYTNFNFIGVGIYWLTK